MGSSSSGSTNTPMKGQAFLEDDGLASVSDMEAGFSGKIAVFSMSSKGNGGSCSNFRAFSPRSLPFSSHPLRHLSIMYDDRCEESRHFLDACFLCKKPLGGNGDIFMYRGDTPFCSEECRQEQIEVDEAEEKNRNLSIKAASRKDPKKSPTRGRENEKLPVRTGTVAAG